MESIQSQVTEATGALNAVLSQLKALDQRMKALEDRPSSTGALSVFLSQLKSLEQRTKTLEDRPLDSAAVQGELSTDSPPLQAPATEEDLNAIGKLPDCIKELQPFEGNPIHYVSWVHSVESILSDYQIVKNKPIYRAIIQAIRRKCRGSADAALTSYNIFDEDWQAIKNCLSLHYADKRDVQTLEHQLNQLRQKAMSIDEFYSKVNHQFSLIINKIKTESYSAETVNVLIETYRNRALDVFVRGLNGELPKMLMIMKPKTLPEAYSQCIEMQNTTYRSQVSLHPTGPQNKIQSPTGLQHSNFTNSSHNRFLSRKPQKSFSQPQYQPHVNPFVNWRHGQHRTAQQPGPEKPEPMDIDHSTQTRRSFKNFNHPWHNKRRAFSEQLRAGSSQRPIKQQRLFHIAEEADPSKDEDTQLPDEELNFMTYASPAYHT